MTPAPRLIVREAASRRIEQLVYQIRALRMAGNVLHVGAHPDDEDAGLIAFMSRKYGSRVVYWSATRGEAGQNRLGAYSGDALGIYRTWESLAARSLDGGESIYGPFCDFGFSKNGAEATAKWGREDLVREIVRAIRLVQPVVVISRFTGESSDGHGHHQAVGSATTEAFDAAVDPHLFTESGLPSWRPLKLYQSTGGDWQPGEETLLGKRRPEFEREGYLRIDTGELDPIAGMTYQQQAWIAFNCHQSQAMGFLPEHGNFYYYYLLKKSLVPINPIEESFFDGLDPTLVGLACYAGNNVPDAMSTIHAVRLSVDAALARLHPADPSAAAGPLREGLDRLRRLRAGIEAEPDAGDHVRALARQLDDKIARFEDVIFSCLGLDAECIVERAHVVAGQHVRVRARFWNPRAVHIESNQLSLVLPDGWKVANVKTQEPRLNPGAPATEQDVDYDLVVAADSPPTTPYWLREPHNRYRYTTAPDFACEAFSRSLPALECELSIEGQKLTIRRPALRREPFAGGFRELPLSVLPAISVKPQNPRVFVPVLDHPFEFEMNLAIQRHVELKVETQLRLVCPDGWSVDPAVLHVPGGAQGDMTAARFRVRIPANTASKKYRLQCCLGSDGSKAVVSIEPVWMGAPGIPRPPDTATCIRETFLAKPADVDVHIIDARFAQGLKYGYVRGAAEGVLDALANFGLSIDVISDESMGYMDLSAYDAIVIGPNAYLVRDELRRNSGRFLDYAAGGGTLIVHYQAYGYELHEFAPYPFDYSHPHDRVTYPEAPVTVLRPKHALLTWPNSITGRDFDGWIHDRGLYFFGKFDERYTPILECNDPGEAPKPGGLLVANYGRGAFVYTGYSLFRQVPAGVPGAFCLLANLLALPEALILERVERIRNLSLFSFMTEQQLMAVAKIAFERDEKAGAYLCRQGEVGKELFIVMKGEVEISRKTENQTIQRSAGEGQVLGEFAVLADIPRTADLRAATDVHLLVMSGVHFRAFVRNHSEIAENLIRLLVLKLVEN